MDVACFETLMKTKDWEKPSYGIVPNYDLSSYLVEDYTIMDITFRKGTRQLLISELTVRALDAENFESWYKEKTKGFIF